MMALGMISLVVIVAITLLIKGRKPQKTIYTVNFTLDDKKSLPAKKFYTVNYIHNKDVVPVKNRALIRNYVI
jgi:hypothetical protein